MPRKSKHAIPDEKRDLLLSLIRTYDIKTTGDLQDALKDLLGGTIQTMLEQEIAAQIEEREAADPEYNDSRNGYKDKTLRSTMGEIPIQVPQDRKSDFEPMIVPKYHRDISQIEGKIIAMYARGMSTRQISEQVKDIYGFEVSEGLVTGITNQLLPEIEAWQKRPLSAVYPIVFIDAIVFNVREDNIIRKSAAYVILGVSEEGHKEVLGITVGETESAKFWLSALNELKNRGVKDIFVLCADGLSGIKEAIAAAYPMTEYQRCIVHMVRNTLKYVADKDMKAFANDLEPSTTRRMRSKAIRRCAPSPRSGRRSTQAACDAGRTTGTPSALCLSSPKRCARSSTRPTRSRV
jgi:transposase-like protein